jgi:uncharacterized protein YkwD
MRITLRTAAAALLVTSAAWMVACSGDPNGLPGWGTGTGQGNGNGNGNGDGTGDDAGGGGNDAGASMPGADAGTPPPHADASPPPTTHDAGPPPAQDSGTTPPPGFDQFQQHNLEVVNQYRATLGVAPLVLDKQLCTFAQAGSVELSQDHMPHQHFINAGNTLWSSGFVSGAAENQGDPNGWYQMSQDPMQNELLQIDDIQKAMFDEGPGSGEAHGHYTNMMNAQYKRLGVGLLEVSGKLYLTNDFSD